MNWPETFKTGILPGAIAGLIGGLVYAATVANLNMLPSIAELIGSTSSGVGLIVALIVAVVIGSGFGLLIWHQRTGAGETLFWGLVYGIFWWYIGPLTLMSLFQGEGLDWDIGMARTKYPLLLAHVQYGIAIALAYVILRWRHYRQSGALRVGRGAAIRGAFAGLIAGAFLGVMLSSQNLDVPMAALMDNAPSFMLWLIALLIGLTAGVVFALLFPNPTDSTGPVLIRGALYGFAWWTVASLTIAPLLAEQELTWTVEQVRARFPTFPAYFLFGAAVALFYQWLGGLVRVLFSDVISEDDEEGVGTQGLRILGRSLLGGLIGGILFSLVMLQIGFLDNVAGLIGSSSPVAGFFVHLVIASIIGISYGLLFHRQAFDVASAIGWGSAYGFFWWVLGPLTLMPIFLGRAPYWTADTAASVMANLIGHLAYGAGLAITFYILEARHSPWWLPRTQVEAERLARRREQALTSAPALWSLMLGVGLTLPILLGSQYP